MVVAVVSGGAMATVGNDLVVDKPSLAINGLSQS